MHDPSRTNQELLEENALLNQRIRELEHLEAERKRAEEELQESENRLREITTQVPGVVYQFYVRPTGAMGFYYISDRSEPVLGLKPDLDGYFERFSAIVIPEHRDGFIKSIEKSVKEASEWKYEGMLQKPSGEIIWFSGHSSPSLRENEVVFNGIVQDISDRRRAEEELRESEKDFRSVIDHIQDVFYRSDREGRLTMGSPSGVRFFGYDSMEEMMGLPLEVFWVNPADREIMFKQMKDQSTLEDAEAVLKKKDGTPFYASFTTHFLYDDQGAILGTEGIIRDITKRKQAELALRESEERFSLAFKASPGPMAISEIETGRFIDVNEQTLRVLEFTKEEMIGHTSYELGIWDDPESRTQMIMHLHGEGSFREFPVRFITKFRHTRDVLWSAEIITLGNKKVLLSMFYDITERKQAEKTMIESEERFRLIAENAKVVIWMMDMNLRYTYMSPYIKHNLDYTPEEYMVKPLYEVMTPSSLELCMQLFTKELDEEKNPGRDSSRSRTIEVEHIHRDGRIIPAEINITFIRDSAGSAEGILGITRDITDQKHAEVVLRRSERRYRQLIDQAVDGIFVVNPNGDYLLVNKHFCEMLHYTEEELLKLNVIDTYPDELKDIGRQRFQRVTSGETMRFERPMKRKDGTVFQVELSVSRLDDGRQQGIIHDITERKKTEEELRSLSIALEQAAEDVIITDPEGIIQYVNPAFEKITGYSRVEVIGQTPKILKSDVQAPAFYEKLWKTIKGGNIWTGRITNRRKDGKLIQEDAIISPLLNSAGELTGYVSLKRDVTEAVRMETQLRQAQKMEAIGTLAGGIAHDFNNILGAMMGYAELAKFKTTDVNTHPYMDQVLKACGRAKDLVKQILTFSRQREQEKKPIAVTPIVREAMKLLRSSLPATVEIRQSYTNGNDTVLADPTQLHQVIMNLCTNAVHAMREREGVLEIRLDQQVISNDYPAYDQVLKSGAYLQLTVSDTGEGIDPAIKDKIFDPFFTTKKPGEGTGLGLSIIYGIVRDHGGVIAVESKPGEGTTFTISLPLIDVADQQEDQEPIVIPRGSGRILLVDDEEPIASLGEGMLTSLGYEVTVRFSSRDALETYRAHPEKFDLIITDMTMPKMTGASLAREVLKIRPGFPIILTTGFSERINEAEAKKIGIREFLMKPVSLPILAQIVKRVMDNVASAR